MKMSMGFGEYKREMTVQVIEGVDQPKDYELAVLTIKQR
jgi:hypothetical protein